MLYHHIIAVKPQSDYTLLLTLADGRTGIFDVKPYLDKGIFRQLRDPELFGTVRPYAGNSFAWANRADIAPERIFEKTVFVNG